MSEQLLTQIIKEGKIKAELDELFGKLFQK